MIYTAEHGHVCLSAKTSLRERYKQAALEGMILKNVHRKSLSFLLTLEANEAIRLKSKIISGDIYGLDDIIVATSSDFDSLVKRLKKLTSIPPPKVDAIKCNQIITSEKVKGLK